jgi:hypothetical protein
VTPEPALVLAIDSPRTVVAAAVITMKMTE